jgi:hypothetical protein
VAWADISEVGFFLNLPRLMKIKQNASEKIGSRIKILTFAPNGKEKRDSLGFLELLTD